MNTWETALVYILENDPAVAALVGDRISTDLPQNPTLPAITYEEIFVEQDALVDFAKVRVQITPWALGYSDVKVLEKTIRYALQRYVGTTLGVRIELIVFISKRYVKHPETGRHTMPADYRISYWEE